MTAMPRIGNLDEFLLAVVDGLPPGPYNYEFRCHPDVYQAIREAAPAAEWTVPGGPIASRIGKYGSAAITVDRSIGSGAWELLERGEVLNSGQLPATEPATRTDAVPRLPCRGRRRTRSR